MSLALIPVVPAHAEQWQKLKVQGYVIFARWAGFQRNNDYFAASEAARVAPKVDFSTPKQ